MQMYRSVGTPNIVLLFAKIFMAAFRKSEIWVFQNITANYLFYPPFNLSSMHINNSFQKSQEALNVREINNLIPADMHSIIFQITTKELSGSKILNEDTISQGDGFQYDYCSEIDEEERERAIQTLVNDILPKGMFELCSSNSMKYKGGVEEWKQACIDDIRTKAQSLTPDNIIDWIGPIYQLEKAIKNPLGTSYQFYFDEENIQCYAEESYELLRFISDLEVGTTLYFGGVIDYDF